MAPGKLPASTDHLDRICWCLVTQLDSPARMGSDLSRGRRPIEASGLKPISSTHTLLWLLPDEREKSHEFHHADKTSDFAPSENFQRSHMKIFAQDIKDGEKANGQKLIPFPPIELDLNQIIFPSSPIYHLLLNPIQLETKFRYIY